MVADELIAWTADRLPCGQQQIATSMKQLVAGTDSAAASLLNFADDAPFMEPLLFGYFSPEQTPVTLDQILYGYIPVDHRPASIKVRTSRDGTVFLPNLGYVCVNLPDSELALTQTATGGEFITAQDARREITCQPVDIAGTDIEIATHGDPLTDQLFAANGRPDAHIAINESARQHEDAVVHALDVLAESCPELAQSFLMVMRRIVIFRDDVLDSFASFSAHGTAFLNARADVEEVFFVEDLAHQCGHVLFSAVTLHRQEFFAVDPDAVLKSATGNVQEHRSMYVALHGLFTECLMGVALNRCLQADVFSGRQQHELLGRLSFILKRLQLDLQNLDCEGVFSAKGAELYRLFTDVFDEIYRGTGKQLVRFDFRNQPYTFCYDRFAALNPIA